MWEEGKAGSVGKGCKISRHRRVSKTYRSRARSSLPRSSGTAGCRADGSSSKPCLARILWISSEAALEEMGREVDMREEEERTSRMDEYTLYVDCLLNYYNNATRDYQYFLVSSSSHCHNSSPSFGSSANRFALPRRAHGMKNCPLASSAAGDVAQYNCVSAPYEAEYSNRRYIVTSTLATPRKKQKRTTIAACNRGM